MRDISVEAQFSGDWLVQAMQSEEGDCHETWSVQRTHTGWFVMTYRGKHQMITTRYPSLEDMERGAGGEGGVDVPDDVIAQAHYALEAIDHKIKEAWKQFIVEKAVKAVSQVT